MAQIKEALHLGKEGVPADLTPNMLTQAPAESYRAKRQALNRIREIQRSPHYRDLTRAGLSDLIFNSPNDKPPIYQEHPVILRPCEDYPGYFVVTVFYYKYNFAGATPEICYIDGLFKPTAHGFHPYCEEDVVVGDSKICFPVPDGEFYSSLEKLFEQEPHILAEMQSNQQAEHDYSKGRKGNERFKIVTTAQLKAQNLSILEYVAGEAEQRNKATERMGKIQLTVPTFHFPNKESLFVPKKIQTEERKENDQAFQAKGVTVHQPVYTNIIMPKATIGKPTTSHSSKSQMKMTSQNGSQNHSQSNKQHSSTLFDDESTMIAALQEPLQRAFSDILLKTPMSLQQQLQFKLGELEELNARKAECEKTYKGNMIFKEKLRQGIESYKAMLESCQQKSKALGNQEEGFENDEEEFKNTLECIRAFLEDSRKKHSAANVRIVQIEDELNRIAKVQSELQSFISSLQTAIDSELDLNSPVSDRESNNGQEDDIDPTLLRRSQSLNNKSAGWAVRATSDESPPKTTRGLMGLQPQWEMEQTKLKGTKLANNASHPHQMSGFQRNSVL